MDNGMIGKIEKAKRYAEERERIRFESFRATFDELRCEGRPEGKLRPVTSPLLIVSGSSALVAAL